MKLVPISLFLQSIYASAAVLYTHFPIDENPSGWTSNLSNNPASLNQTADNFSLSTASTIREIAWHGHMIVGPNNAPDTFLIRVFEDLNGLPSETPLFSTPVIAPLTPTATRSTAIGGIIYLYTAAATIPLDQGDYWLSVVKTYPSLEQSSLWVWHESDLGLLYRQPGWGLARRELGEGDSWTFANASERSFEIRDQVTIPEPHTMLLILLSLTGLFRRTRN
ncbi:MAG: hypothetical protein ACSHYB_17120 [Roseibacillus sp.]